MNEQAIRELEQLYMSLSEEKKKALDVAFKAMEQADRDCRDCAEWKSCPCGKDGHEKGTAQGYSAGKCKDYKQADGEYISRQALFEELADTVANGNWNSPSDLQEITDILNRMPSVKADGEYINRILKRMWAWRSKNTQSIDKVAMEMILRDALPSVAIPNKVGHWIFLDECANEGVYCSECNKKVFRADFSNTMQKWKNYKFCPHCGHPMEIER